MSLESNLASAALNSGFQEMVTIDTPGEPPREIFVIVERDAINPQVNRIGGVSSDGVRPFPLNGIRLHILRDHVKGLIQVKEGQTTVTVAIKEGGPEVKMVITQTLSQDRGMFYVEAEV